ncbi:MULTISPECIES: hypothetical protein [unclassified Exiguobacterium]|uniref:hypothetical protein n=1 Tax=unclassified Exiguobacterium TaxID=2644629 RepID=UPI000EEA2534|nr:MULTISPECIES: hypothetical protein [unclassified Exiguobacterium]HAL00981.1 hypothetical protein [Exiguobacterium sp.]
MSEMTIEMFVHFVQHLVHSPRFIVQRQNEHENAYMFEIRELNLSRVSKAVLLHKTVDLLQEKTSEDTRETLTNELVTLSQKTLMKSDTIATLKVESTIDDSLHLTFSEDKKIWFSGNLDTEEAINRFTEHFQSVINDDRTSY